MHPAYSIIVFTTLSGAGYGLAALLGLGLLPLARTGALLGYGLALALVTVGLVASLFHLRRPERAWRALSQWRSSWLSREGVLALATYLPLGVAALGWLAHGERLAWAGAMVAVLCVATVFATSMIYTSLKTVPRWHQPLTPALYLAFALSGGSLLLAFVAAATGHVGTGPVTLALLALLIAAAVQHAWWRRGDRAVPSSTPETATGLGHLGRVRLLEPPHHGDNYLTREMGFRVARKHAAKLRRIALALGFALPILLGAAAWIVAPPPLDAALLALAAALHLAGALVARWLFFAEARHAVMNYYGGR